MNIRQGWVTMLLVGAGIAFGWWLQRPEENSQPPTPSERQVLYWYDPMMPQQHFDKPGKSPFMDMQLVPRYAGDAEAGEGITVSGATQHNLGMRMAKVARIARRSEFAATGILAYSEREMAIVQARASGYARSVRALAAGDRIAAGSMIAELVLPDWSAAEQDWLIVRASEDTGLIRAAAARLHALGIDEAEIGRLENEGLARRSFSVRAPHTGVVQSVDIRQGMSVVPGQPLVRINGTAVVWLEIAVPEAMAAKVRRGDVVAARSSAMPSREIRAEVAEVLPALDPASRTLPVRIELPNADGQLRPGQSMQVVVRSSTDGDALAVPTEAVIRTGRRSLVMLAENGRFRPVEVELGGEIGDQTLIAKGLSEGQEIVASGQFLLDSEASLKGMDPAAEDGP